jgi:hypothetical protein
MPKVLQMLRVSSCDSEAERIVADLLAALESAAKWMDFVAEKLGNKECLDYNIRKYGARRWIPQFGQGASHRAREARTAIAKATE